MKLTSAILLLFLIIGCNTKTDKPEPTVVMQLVDSTANVKSIYRDTLVIHSRIKAPDVDTVFIVKDSFIVLTIHDTVYINLKPKITTVNQTGGQTAEKIINNQP